MTDLTSEKISLVMLALDALRLTGRLGATEPVTPESMARWSVELGCPVSEKTFRRMTQRSVLAVRKALKDDQAQTLNQTNNR